MLLFVQRVTGLTGRVKGYAASSLALPGIGYARCSHSHHVKNRCSPAQLLLDSGLVRDKRHGNLHNEDKALEPWKPLISKPRKLLQCKCTSPSTQMLLHQNKQHICSKCQATHCGPFQGLSQTLPTVIAGCGSVHIHPLTDTVLPGRQQFLLLLCEGTTDLHLAGIATTPHDEGTAVKVLLADEGSSSWVGHGHSHDSCSCHRHQQALCSQQAPSVAVASTVVVVAPTTNTAVTGTLSIAA